jgi:hypothetical protein
MYYRNESLGRSMAIKNSFRLVLSIVACAHGGENDYCLLLLGEITIRIGE